MKASISFQEEAAIRAVQYLTGVRGITTKIVIKSSVEPENVKKKNKKTVERNAALDVDEINILVVGHKETHSGNARSWDAAQQAKNAAWSAPGVWEVVDWLVIKTRKPEGVY